MSNFDIKLNYFDRLKAAIDIIPLEQVSLLKKSLLDAISSQKQLFIIGNGGSAGNAIHLANDFLYGIAKKNGKGIKVHALPANPSIITCLANDEGYESIFDIQLKTFANKGDLLLAFTGSGNSPNVLKALEVAKHIGMVSFLIVGFDGGKAKKIADHVLHTPVFDMQISEDLQMLIGHALMQNLT